MILSKFIAYRACYCFLNNIWSQDKHTFPYDLPILLSDMQLLPDGKSADPAVIQDWNSLIGAEVMSIEKGYEAIKVFLRSKLYNNDETKIIVEKMESEYDKMWSLWSRCIDEVLDT